MWRHRLTSIFGAIAGIAEMIHRQGITIGHIGNTDAVAFTGALALIGLGLSAGDALLANKNAAAVANLISNNNGGTLRKLNPDGTPAPRDPVRAIQEK